MQPLRAIPTLLARSLSRHRYLLLCLLVLFKVAIHATNGIWYGDFWEHSAAVKAFVTDPFHPSHPFFALSAPHAFLTPYHLMVASFVRLTGLDVINSLALFGVVNYCLLVTGLFWYVRGFAGDHAARSSFFALLCILFLWGPNPWGYSGFLHFGLIADVLPYASTFAAAISLIVLAIGFGGLRIAGPRQAIAITVLSAIVLLSHPLTYVFLATGLFCQCLQGHDSTAILRQTGRLVLILAASCALATCWPYFSIVALLTGAGDVYHSSNRLVYVDIIQRTWPIFLLSPLMFGALRNAKERTILLHILLLVMIYGMGYATGKYSYGRDVTFIAILAQILIGDRIARLETSICSSRPMVDKIMCILIGVALLAWASTWLMPTVTRSLTVLNSLRLGRQVSNQQMYADLTFLPRFVQTNDVVLSDIETSWLVPTFAGKVIAGLHAQAFIDDQETRIADLKRFFDPQSDDNDRRSIIQTYKPAFLLLDKQEIAGWQTIDDQFDRRPDQCRVFDNARYRLIRLDCKH